jgi:hypothetical protein
LILDLRFSEQWPRGVNSLLGREKWSVAFHAACFLLGTCLPYISILKMEAECSSETSVALHLTVCWWQNCICGLRK